MNTAGYFTKIGKREKVLAGVLLVVLFARGGIIGLLGGGRT